MGALERYSHQYPDVPFGEVLEAVAEERKQWLQQHRPTPDDLPGPALRRMAEVTPREVDWLWPGRIPLGKVTVIAGDPGLGKSMLTIDLAARVSRGRAWPDALEQPGTAGDVLLVSAEDDLEDTIAPRLIAAEADMNRVQALEGVRRERGVESWSMRDAPDLAAAIDRMQDCRLVVIDPVGAFYGGADDHKNSDTRALIAPLARLATSRDVAVVLVHHLNKSGGARGMYRVTGSLGLIAAARAGWIVAADPDDERRRLFLNLKSNLSTPAPGLAYRIAGDTPGPRVEWIAGEVRHTADSVLAAMQGGEREPSETERAAEWLREALANGARPAREIIAEGEEMGFAKRTLRRAYTESIGGTPTRHGYGAEGGWWWGLPPGKGATLKGANPGERDLAPLDSDPVRGDFGGSGGGSAPNGANPGFPGGLDGAGASADSPAVPQDSNNRKKAGENDDSTESAAKVLHSRLTWSNWRGVWPS